MHVWHIIYLIYMYKCECYLCHTWLCGVSASNFAQEISQTKKEKKRIKGQNDSTAIGRTFALNAVYLV